MSRMDAEQRLPKTILDKAVLASNEYGWREEDFAEVVEAARQVPMGIIGGQVQYRFPDATCELYWLSYDPKSRQRGEGWVDYCNRSAKECMEKFNLLISTGNIEKEALEWPFIAEQKSRGVDINKYKIFLLYFNDKGLES